MKLEEFSWSNALAAGLCHPVLVAARIRLSTLGPEVRPFLKGAGLLSGRVPAEIGPWSAPYSCPAAIL